jgi:hypothetical protein
MHVFPLFPYPKKTEKNKLAQGIWLITSDMGKWLSFYNLS